MQVVVLEPPLVTPEGYMSRESCYQKGAKEFERKGHWFICTFIVDLFY